MIRSLGIRIGVLLFVMLTFSTMAHAYQGSTFRLLIEDSATQVERVITDNATLGRLNVNGDTNSALGVIQFGGYVGNFYVTIDATSTKGARGGGVLTLSANVAYQSSGNDQILIAVEDTGYVAPSLITPLATFTDTVGGYNSSTNTVTPSGALPSSATSISLQSWFDVAGHLPPAFGNNSGPEQLQPLTIPGTATNINSQRFMSNTFSSPATGVQVKNLLTGYTLASEVAVNYTGAGGTTDFSLTAAETPGTTSVPVPEPTSLMLLGSALLVLKVVRRKKQR